MTTKNNQQKNQRTQKIPRCPNIDAEYAECVIQCSAPCLWGLQRRAEYRKTGK